MQLSSHLITLFKHLWTPHLVLPTITIPPLSAFSQINKKQKLRAILLTLTIELMGPLLLSLLFIQNFLWVLELLTLFQIIFLLIIVIKKMTNIISNNLTQWLLNHCSHNP